MQPSSTDWPAGAAADVAYGEILRVAFAGRRETEVAADLAGLLRRVPSRAGDPPPPCRGRVALDHAAWQAACEPCGTGSDIRAMRGRRVSRW